MLATLYNKQFFYAYKHDDSRLQYVFFVYLELISIYKDNAKVLIYDCTYQVVKSDLLLLCFDFVTRLGSVLLLAYMLIEDKTYDSYIQVLQQLQRLFEEYDIDDCDVLIYDRDRAAINAISTVFLGIQTMLYTQYIDTTVRAYASKTFGQQKDNKTNRFVPSKLANKFLVLYRKYRFAESKLAFDKACAALNKRAKCGKTYYNDSDQYDLMQRNLEVDYKIDEELDAIARPINNPTALTTTVKDTPVRQQKIIRYLQTAWQVYKEKYVKAQTNKIRHFGYNVSSGGESAYKGLKVQTTSSRNNTLTFFIKLALFYDGYLDREKAKLSYVQNTISTAFVYKEYYYKINTIVGTRALYYIQKQKQKLECKLESLRTDRYYERPYYSSIFIHTIGIDCLHKLEGKDFLTTESFDEFQIILGTYNVGSSPALRLLELATKLRKRAVRLVYSYTTSTGTSSNIRDPIGAKRNNPNNRYTPTGEEEEDNATQLTRRNSKP